MIVRILGTGQYRLDDGDLAEVEAADDRVEQALAAGDEAALQSALGNLIDTILSIGTPVADQELATSDVIVPPRDTTLAEVAGMTDGDEGLIPG